MTILRIREKVFILIAATVIGGGYRLIIRIKSMLQIPLSKGIFKNMIHQPWLQKPKAMF